MKRFRTTAPSSTAVRMMGTLTIAAAALLLPLAGSRAQQAPKADPAAVDALVAATFKSATQEWRQRIEPDATQKICSQYRNVLPADEFAKVLEREKAAVVMPADGNVIGDWKSGEQIAQIGTGGQFTDKPSTPNGGNCYACHQLTATELSYGTMGPSLRQYGKIRNFTADAAKAAYAKIYDAQSVLPCSSMPRFGHQKFLTEQQIKDVVALLLDPQSPVNK